MKKKIKLLDLTKKVKGIKANGKFGKKDFGVRIHKTINS